VKEWLTLKEASNITGRSVHTIRMFIKRNENVKAKKTRQKGRECWVLHREEVHKLTSQNKDSVNDSHEGSQLGEHVNLISFETYTQHRNEWDKQRSQLEQGLMMYRFKFEELDRKLKLLPAPAEIVIHELEELQEQANRLKDTEDTLQATQDKLQDTHTACQKAEEERNAIIVQMKAKDAIQAELEGDKRQAEERAEELQKEKEELEARLEEERRRPWWKKLFGME